MLPPPMMNGVPPWRSASAPAFQPLLCPCSALVLAFEFQPVDQPLVDESDTCTLVELVTVEDLSVECDMVHDLSQLSVVPRICDSSVDSVHVCEVPLMPPA